MLEQCLEQRAQRRLGVPAHAEQLHGAKYRHLPIAPRDPIFFLVGLLAVRQRCIAFALKQAAHEGLNVSLLESTKHAAGKVSSAQAHV